MPCQAFIDVEEVRVHQIADGEIVAHHGGNEGKRLAFQRIDQILVQLVFGIEALVRIVPAQMAEIEPVAREVLHEPVEAGAVDQAVCFPPQCTRGLVRRLSSSCASGLELVRKCESRSAMAKLSFGLAQVQEQIRAQEGLITGQHRLA